MHIRTLSRFLVHTLVALLISACVNSSPEQQAGEIVKENLRSPSSFKYIDGVTLWSGQTMSGDSAYIVAVLYDAQNGFGALLRGCAIVAYHLAKDGKLIWNNALGFRDMNQSLMGMCDKSIPLERKFSYVKTIAEINKFIDGNGAKSKSQKLPANQYEDAYQTVGGKITIVDKALRINGADLNPKIEGDFSLSVERNIKFKEGNAILLFNNTGGTNCPGVYRWVMIEKDNISFTNEFGTCSDMPEIQISKSKLTVILKKLRESGQVTYEFDGTMLTEFN